MDEHLEVLRHSEVNDQVDMIDVQTTSSHVGSDEDGDPSSSEAIEDLLSNLYDKSAEVEGTTA